VGKIKELSDVLVTANYPYIHAARTPETVSAELMILRFDVWRPFRFRQAMITVGETAEPVRVAPDRRLMLFARATYRLNSPGQWVLH
jgi:hypothetical protein